MAKKVPVAGVVSDPTFVAIGGPMPGCYDVKGTLTLNDQDEQSYYVAVVDANSGVELSSMEQDGVVTYPSPGVRKYKYKTTGGFVYSGTTVRIIAYVMKSSAYSGNSDTAP